MQRLSRRTIAKRKAQCESARASDAEITHCMTHDLPDPPKIDGPTYADWLKWKADHQAYLAGLRPDQERLLELVQRRYLAGVNGTRPKAPRPAEEPGSDPVISQPADTEVAV